jgi:hypothetical protein
MFKNYWNFGAQNGLAGVEGTYRDVDNCTGQEQYIPDPVNPAILSDAQILYTLRTSRRARQDFRKVFPTLLQEEKDRLTELLEKNPLESSLVVDDQRLADLSQSRMIKASLIRTCGRRGGGGF